MLDCQKITALLPSAPSVQADFHSCYTTNSEGLLDAFAVVSLDRLLFPFVHNFAVLCCCYAGVCRFNLFLGGVASHTTNCSLHSQTATELPYVLKLLILHCGQCYIAHNYSTEQQTYQCDIKFDNLSSYYYWLFMQHVGVKRPATERGHYPQIDQESISSAHSIPGSSQRQNYPYEPSQLT